MGGAKGVPHSHHGMSGTRLYKLWVSMMNRCGHYKCSNPAAIKYYINKGIVVCEQWRTFLPFAEWALANSYSDSLTLDRIDSSKNYEPSNCQWVTMAANLRKRSGVTLTMEKAQEIRRLFTVGCRQIDIAVHFNITPNQVSRVCSGKRWSEDIA